MARLPPFRALEAIEVTAPGKKKLGDVDDVIVVPVSALNDIGAFGHFCTAWIFRGAEIAEGRNFKAPVTAMATDANGKQCFAFELGVDTGKKFDTNDIGELDLDAVAMPMVMVIEDSEGRVARVRIQMESQTLQ